MLALLSPNFVKIGPVVPEIWPSTYVARGAILLCNVSQVSLCTVIPKFFCHFPPDSARLLLRFFPITLIACVGFNACSLLFFLFRARCRLASGHTARGFGLRPGLVRSFLGVVASSSSGLPAARLFSLSPIVLAAESSFEGGDLHVSLLALSGLSASFWEES